MRKTTLPERLNARRTERGMTHAELARRCGVATATVKAWCGARGQVPGREHRRRLVELLWPGRPVDPTVLAVFGAEVL